MCVSTDTLHLFFLFKEKPSYKYHIHIGGCGLTVCMESMFLQMYVCKCVTMGVNLRMYVCIGDLTRCSDCFL